MKRLCTLAAAGAVALAAGCAGNGLDDDDGIPVGAAVVPSEQVVYEEYSGIEMEERLVIRSEAEWAAFWNELYANQAERPARPDINFDEEVVVVAAMGERSTGGYGIEIENLYETPEGLRAVVIEMSPAEDCVLSQAQTAPVSAVRVPVTDREIDFVEREAIRECD